VASPRALSVICKCVLKFSLWVGKISCSPVRCYHCPIIWWLAVAVSWNGGVIEQWRCTWVDNISWCNYIIQIFKCPYGCILCASSWPSGDIVVNLVKGICVHFHIFLEGCQVWDSWQKTLDKNEKKTWRTHCEQTERIWDRVIFEKSQRWENKMEVRF